MFDRVDFDEQNIFSREYFPTTFACSVGENVNLYPKGLPSSHGGGLKRFRADKKVQRLKWFQEISMDGTFEEAVIAYSNIELSNRQILTLRIIHGITKKQARGHLANNIFNKIREGCDSRDLKSMGELLLTITSGEENIKIGEAIEKLVINVKS